MASLTLAVKAELERQDFARQRVKIALETNTHDYDGPTRGTAAGDSRKLRGIPAIGRSVAGAIPGTSPHHCEWASPSDP